MTSNQAALALFGGAVGGVVTLLVARAVKRYSSAVLAAVLIGAQLFYVGFAYQADAGPAWIMAEVLALLAFSGMGVAGVRGSLWWLVAGWTLHPVWDVVLHYFGAGRAFTPEVYPVACVPWDLIVAGAIAWKIARSSTARAFAS